MLDPKTARTAIFLAKAYDHKIRRAIIELLMNNPSGLYVADIYLHPSMAKNNRPMEQSLCSQHLTWLRKYKIVNTERQGRQIKYSISTETVKRAGDLMKQLAQLAKAA